MRPILRNLKPASGVSQLLHLVLSGVILPFLTFALVRLDFIQPALILIVLSKWRMFAVKPRFWPANLRANAVDLMVGFSLVLFMDHTTSLSVQVLWAVLYGVWLLALKPRSGMGMVTAQAFVGQLVALSALFLAWGNGPVYGLTASAGLLCFLAAHHFFDAFDEPYAKMLSYIWGYFGAALTWLLSHWLLFYRGVSQPTLLLSALGYGLAVLYYLDSTDRLSKNLKRQFIFIMAAIIIVVVVFSDWWGNKIV